jgi:lipoxygenase
VCAVNEQGWLDDEEFGRQRLAGINPMHIELLTSFPVVSKLDDPEERFGDPTSAITHKHIEPYLDGMTVEQVNPCTYTSFQQCGCFEDGV